MIEPLDQSGIQGLSRPDSSLSSNNFSQGRAEAALEDQAVWPKLIPLQEKFPEFADHQRNQST
jgi:hypothetical protein